MRHERVNRQSQVLGNFCPDRLRFELRPGDAGPRFSHRETPAVEVIANGVGENHASIGQNHRVSAYAIRLLGGIAFRAERGHAFA